jgi:hypothetical protein
LCPKINLKKMSSKGPETYYGSIPAELGGEDDDQFGKLGLKTKKK